MGSYLSPKRSESLIHFAGTTALAVLYGTQQMAAKVLVTRSVIFLVKFLKIIGHSPLVLDNDERLLSKHPTTLDVLFLENVTQVRVYVCS